MRSAVITAISADGEKTVSCEAPVLSDEVPEGRHFREPVRWAAAEGDHGREEDEVRGSSGRMTPAEARGVTFLPSKAGCGRGRDRRGWRRRRGENGSDSFEDGLHSFEGACTALEMACTGRGRPARVRGRLEWIRGRLAQVCGCLTRGIRHTMDLCRRSAMGRA